MTRAPFHIRLLLSIAVAVILIPSMLALRDYRNRTILNVGYLTALTGDLKDKQGLAISGALTMALDEINSDDKLLPNVSLKLRWNDTKGDTVVATKAITEMVCDGIAIIFGPEGHCYVEAVVSQARNIPMISYKCAENRASAIPTFARTEPPDTQVIKSVISLLRYYDWKKFSIVYDELWVTVADLLKDQALKRNMTINHKQPFTDNKSKCCALTLPCCRSGYWYQIVQNTMNRTRIYVFLGAATSLVDFMASMDTANLFTNGEYMVIFVDMMVYSPKEAEKYLRKAEQVEAMTSCNEPQSFKTLARSLLVVASTPPTKSYETFTAKVREYNSREPFKFVLPDIFYRNKFLKFVSIYAAYLYDSVKLYAWALDKLLRLEERELTDEVIEEVASNGTRIIETIIKNRQYRSVTGATIKIDMNGDSEGNFSVLAFKPYEYKYRENLSCNFHMVPVAYFQEGDDIPEYKLINGSVRVDWPSGNDRPSDEPMCGFANELCKKDDRHNTSVLAAGVLAVLLFCAVVVTMSIYRKWKIELEIEGLLWKIDISEIKGYSGNDIVSSPSKVSLVSAQSFGSRFSNQFVTSTARLRGAIVRIKELKFIRKRDISREIMKEMRLLRELRHDNINSFIGACVEPMRILLVTDYCAKGSLYDIIENEDIKLDDLFIASLIHDLIKGMIYLHSSALIYHGNLKSSNCVVTSRWMLQVTDFGLHELRQCAESESIGEHQHYRNQFWKAPELLRSHHVYGSQKGDVYAFAIIMYEIFSRKGPFGQTAYEPKEIVDLVKKLPTKGDAPFRPEVDCLIDGELCPDYVLSCIRDCWSEDPEERPDFPTVRTRLKKMRGGKTKNIMDQMMEMMEKYANNLEDIVTERTRLLCEEKRKTEDLLHRMLPQSVAEKLTMGQGVEPVSYDLVTIYFSDIVGFTAMSAESTPLQVVNFLNDLYTVFDRIIRGYDVYKVETIGDAYMVVSGLPIKNGDRHAGEIASMALELLQAVKQHRIAHRPNETLKLRIGMHTGPVVAGVVGLTMPRYCLFGDTVNTASRMESNGEALKIHISSKCKEALDKLDGYVVENRGIVNMKGKGDVITYWLVGATEKAIQKKPVDMTDLPPPLFSRPRKSPKLNCESRQPSILAMHYAGAGSRRQSSVPRAVDVESMCSLQFAGYQLQRESPRLPTKRQIAERNAAAAAAATAALAGGGSYNGMSMAGYHQGGNGNGYGIAERICNYYGGIASGIAGTVLETASQASQSTLNHSETNETNCDNRSETTAATNGGHGATSYSSELPPHQQQHQQHHHPHYQQLSKLQQQSSAAKPLAMVRPHRIVHYSQMPTSASTQEIYDIERHYATAQAQMLRESRSLDPMPIQMPRKRQQRGQSQGGAAQDLERTKLPASVKLLSKINSRSLDTGVSLIIGRNLNHSKVTNAEERHKKLAADRLKLSNLLRAAQHTPASCSPSPSFDNAYANGNGADDFDAAGAANNEDEDDDDEGEHNDDASLLLRRDNGGINFNANNPNVSRRRQSTSGHIITTNSNLPTIVPTNTASNLVNRRRSSAFAGGGGNGGNGGGLSSSSVVPSTYKHLNNNCNGGMTIEEDAQSPLLQRQASLGEPLEELTVGSKRWRSLETVDSTNAHNEHHQLQHRHLDHARGMVGMGGGGGGSVSRGIRGDGVGGSCSGGGGGSGSGGGRVATGNSVSYAADIDGSTAAQRSNKKSARSNSSGQSSSSITSWLVNLFQGNGLRSNESSLRRVGILQSGVRGVAGFTDIPPTPRDRESIV